ncbi:hypothetical protein E2F46_03940 [Luteimonas aestuarii]|uniref:DUF4124 domain-containing protein n=1 Tax=Luteimonas aestuarii TaxID=453837 RepID=A0A4R5U1A4_9GAMM|nr:hypothetical protein [Luteimonas aestuarii]TDK27351.1 hypothetical protein E2F46_03940 [Luteimonas aestuarii]
MPSLAFVCLLWLVAGTAQPTQAQVQRCETADGRTVFTDRACEDVGAVSRLQRGTDEGQASPHRRGCNRTLQDLTFELTMAIDARDANRLAAVYHWPGIGHRDGYAIMDRLDAIAQRPLVDARPLFPEDTPEVAPAASPAEGMEGGPANDGVDPARPPSSSELMRRTTPWRPSARSLARGNASQTADDAATTVPEPATPPPPRRRVPYALQVDQTLAGGNTPSRTVFGLRRHLGCWWVSF